MALVYAAGRRDTVVRYLVPRLLAKVCYNRAHEVGAEVEMRHFDKKRAHALQRYFR